MPVAILESMYECRVQAGFFAVHQVRLADGTLEPLHGHDWKVQAVFAGPQLDAAGMLVDFVAAQGALQDVLRSLHQTELNAAPPLSGLNPTAEHVARTVFEQLQKRLPGFGLAAVYVEEAPGCIAGYLAARR